MGAFGMNTPAYFAVDNVKRVRETRPMVTVRRNSIDTDAELAVTLSTSDTSKVVIPASTTIPSGESSVSVPLEIIDDSIVGGDVVSVLHSCAVHGSPLQG